MAAIERNAQGWIDMIRDAYRTAQARREPVHIISAPSPPGYRVTNRIVKGDAVILRDIIPPRWTPAMHDAERDAFAEYETAAPAIRRMAAILAEAGTGHDVDEVIEAVVRRAVNDEIDRDAKEAGGRYNPRPASIFTKLFGAR